MLGGLLLSVFPWSSIFWVNVPIGVVTVIICLAAVRESREPVPRSFDIPGVALSASGLLLLTFGFVDSADVGWHSPVAAVCVAGGIAVLAVFVARDRAAAAPMVPPALLRSRGFGLASAVYLLAYLAFSGFIYYVTLFFQDIEQWSALRTGLSWLFFCIPYFVVAQLGKRQTAGLSPQKLSSLSSSALRSAGFYLRETALCPFSSMLQRSCSRLGPFES